MGIPKRLLLASITLNRNIFDFRNDVIQFINNKGPVPEVRLFTIAIFEIMLIHELLHKYGFSQYLNSIYMKFRTKRLQNKLVLHIRININISTWLKDDIMTNSNLCQLPEQK